MKSPTINANLYNYQSLVEMAIREIEDNSILKRIMALDHTVWKPDQDEITNRLGWLHIAEQMESEIPLLISFAESIRSEGYKEALLLGMGGSSLAPEVFQKTFGVKKGYLNLAILDSTDPAIIREHIERLDLNTTLFIVSTKSGGTVETLSLFKYFFNQVLEAIGHDQVGSHFVAITDPGSKLVSVAEENRFRNIFINDPNIGGRYSALSYFGLVPAALIGIDLHKLLNRSIKFKTRDELGMYLGAIIGVLAKEGRDKVTTIFSESIENFGDWVEQLIAESTGKEGKGIVPILNEPLGEPNVYGDDRLFVSISLQDDGELLNCLDILKETGQPVVEIKLNDIYDLGGQMYLWELATAIAGYLLEINPFNQPDVESAKILAREMVASFTEDGSLPEVNSSPLQPELLHQFLDQSRPGDYIALQAYTRTNEKFKSTLQTLRLGLRSKYKLATTLGFGPRYLHSTGQLHKGDAGNGLFIQFTADDNIDIGIPDEAGKPQSSLTFGKLKMAQALGDGEALIRSDRRFIRFHLDSDALQKLSRFL